MKRPNILIIYTDQQRWDGVRANGNPDIHTPHLDRLVADGVNFDRCFVQNPVCMPSRVSFLTGQYPSTLGITHMGVPVPEETVTLPRLLYPYGYRSANIGKLHFLPHANRDHRTHHPDYGFDHLEISDEPGTYEDAYRAWVRRKAPDQLPHISVGLAPLTEVWYDIMKVKDHGQHPAERFPKRPVPTRCSDDVTQAAFVAEQSIEFMRQQSRSGQPFLCIASIYSPHSPWVAPQQYFDLYDPEKLTLPTFPPEVDSQRGPDNYDDAELRLARQGYYGQISEVDHQTGRMLAALDELGIAEETIVVFTSDHGEWLGEHLKYGKSYPAHDQCSRVPLIVRWPGQIAAGRALHGLTEAVDVLPTLLECIGAQIPPHLQGVSLWQNLLGDDTPVKESALTEHTGWKSLRTDRFRYVRHTDGREMLYDLAAEWGDYRDVSADNGYTNELTEARHALLQKLLPMERPLARVWPY
ncbi:MAG: sulfatase-like hydrolase/transferase [Caldilineaceae bacterium]|nr:sulfatase-like hydrolase/transferase [Caldilineaceae bacterium]